jgi:hypothetical protein
MVQPSGAIVVGDGRLAAGDVGFTRLLDAHRHAGRNLAELTGNVLEDEEILGTVQWPLAPASASAARLSTRPPRLRGGRSFTAHPCQAVGARRRPLQPDAPLDPPPADRLGPVPGLPTVAIRTAGTNPSHRTSRHDTHHVARRKVLPTPNWNHDCNHDRRSDSAPERAKRPGERGSCSGGGGIRTRDGL